MCRVCRKRPEIADEPHGRCESCVKNGRVAHRFRLAPGRGGDGLVVRAGELSPRALRQRWREPLAAYNGHPAAQAHLGLHELEMVTARERLESIRVAEDLRSRADEALAALRAAAERTDGAW